MEQYDYLKNMENDINDYINENGGMLGLIQENNYKNCKDENDLADALNDSLFKDSNITGFAQESYTCDTWKAEENLCHNLDLLKEACDAFGENISDLIGKSADLCDVTIRCYLLPQAISNVLSERIDELDEAFTKLEEQDALDGANLEGDER